MLKRIRPRIKYLRDKAKIIKGEIKKRDKRKILTRIIKYVKKKVEPFTGKETEELTKRTANKANLKKEGNSNLNKKIIQRKKSKKQRYIEAVVQQTGWTKEYAIEQMEKAKENIGSSYFVYAYFEFYKLTEQEQRKALAKWQKRQENSAKFWANRRKESLDRIVEETGWDRNYAEEQMEQTIARTGCTPGEYAEYKFWQLDNKTIDSIMLLYHTDIIRSKFNTDIILNRTIANKKTSNEFFKDFIHRKWCSNRGTTFEEFKEIFDNCKKIFYKPTAMCGGRGARSFELDEENIETVYNEVMKLPEGVVEEFVVQHPQMSKMSPRVLSTVRIASISSDQPIDKEGNHLAIPYTMLKMGGVTGCVDNLLQGGLGAAIDLETGKLCTDAVDVSLNTYEYHPVTGHKVNGFEVPYFREAVEMVKKIIAEKNMKGYLGWDIAITENGPEVIEVNGKPSPTLLELPFYNTPFRGNKHLLEKYM